MARKNDFSLGTKRVLAARVGHVCSSPDCRARTSGPKLEPDKYATAGDAAHITAASPKGPRYDPSLTHKERRHYNNGIWLCVTHARIIDQDQSRYTVELLRRWKEDAEAEAHRKLGRPQVPEGAQVKTEKLKSDQYKRAAEFLAAYRRLMNQSRGYVLSQVISLQGLTNLAAWRRAQSGGHLRKFKQLCDGRDALWNSPETMALLGSVGDVIHCFGGLSPGRTQEDMRVLAEWEKWSELTSQIGERGPQSDAQVLAWQQASLTLLDASLIVHSRKEREIVTAIKEWLSRSDNSEQAG